MLLFSCQEIMAPHRLRCLLLHPGGSDLPGLLLHAAAAEPRLETRLRRQQCHERAAHVDQHLLLVR